MYWSDRVAKEIIELGEYKPYWVDDMFTPSGYAHIGSLRGPLVHDFIYKSLLDEKQKVIFTYILNDFDPLDGLPTELEKDFSKFMGKPLRQVPSPKMGFKSFADYFANDYLEVMKSLGVNPQIKSSWDMYHEGLFDEVIREALDSAEEIQKIYLEVSGSKKRESGWLPLQVICPNCGKLGTTKVHDWDGDTVAFTCEPALVKWATGCGESGRVSPFGGIGKLPWKVDWPAHWKVIGVTIEGAGKDHSVAGGSRDVARELCKKVFHIKEPYNLPYEFFTLGGKKMSSSKGLGLKARDLSELLPAEVARFLFARTDYRKEIDFNVFGTMAIPDLFDEYDRAYRASSNEDLARAFQISQINTTANKGLFFPRFIDVVNYVQQASINIEETFESIKGEKFTEEESKILRERITYAKVWLEKFAPDDFRLQMVNELLEEAEKLDDLQKEFLKGVIKLLERDLEPEKLQFEIFELAKSLKIESKKAFAAIYLPMLGKTFGPKAAWFLKQYKKEDVIERLNEVISDKDLDDPLNNNRIKKLNKPEIFSIDKSLKDQFPSISVGVAIIKGVNIKKLDEGLEKKKKELLLQLEGLTTEQIGQFSEIESYRKLYREMRVDWHSKRPSPEALLRRVALKKGLYNVNTCVDAYNLIVMKNRVSVGAFDMDKLQFPTVLRFAKEGEEILLLGDDKPTRYEESEIAYFDQKGGFNIDFNFRDAQRTAVQLDTKNLYINVDGVYDITPQKVEQVLEEVCEIITKYCGGKVELFGVEA